MRSASSRAGSTQTPAHRDTFDESTNKFKITISYCLSVAVSDGPLDELGAVVEVAVDVGLWEVGAPVCEGMKRVGSE